MHSVEAARRQHMATLDRMTCDELVREMLKRIGEDPMREGLLHTPSRFWNAWMDYFAAGYKQDPVALLKSFVDGAQGVDEMVFTGSVPVFSHCEHHMVPFFGVAHIGYVPDGRIIGLSKLARVLDVYARRLQVQERLCNQVADALWDGLKPIGVGVVLQCRHLCMESRGVQKVGTITTTSALRGCFKSEPEARSEFMTMVQMAATGTRLI